VRADSLKGWLKVLKFTYIQTIKAKSFIVSTVVMIVIMGLMLAGVNFLPGMFASESETIQIRDEHGNIVAEMEAFKIDKVYIYDNSGLDVDFSFLLGVEVQFEHIEANQIQTIINNVTESDLAIVLAQIENTEYGFDVTMSRPESTDLIGSSDCFALLNVFGSVIQNANLVSLGIPEEDVHKANIWVNTTVNVGGEEPRSEIADVIAGVATSLVSIILMILIISFAQLTAQAIATEKASRVMELLLTSVKPLAVVIGKVLATTLVAISAVIVVGGITTAMFFMMAPFGTIGEVTGMVDTTDPMMMSIATEMGNAFAGFTPFNIFLIVIIFVLGFLFYSLIAGLIGASISKIEDLQTASQPLVYISLLGFYLAYLPPMLGLSVDGERHWITTLANYLPISSPFALPGAILTGDMTGWEIALSIGALAVILGLFALFVAKVYEHIILQNGDRVKIKDMIKLVKNK
jgi:ABC-2 type transport system permease protein